MAVSKAGVLSFILPVFLAGLVTRPLIIKDYAKQLANHVQNANISVEVVSEKINQVVHSSDFKFVLVYGLAAVLTYLAVQLYKAVTEPLALYCDETKYTYLVDGPADGKSAEERVRDLKRCRKVGDVPPVYPNGWMSILMSSELKKKEHKFVAVAGKNLVVFRGESGRPYVVDAYCAHLGANLAIGGSVHGECIECPFHGWSYRGEDGKCVHIGYAEKVPDFVKIPTYQSCEVNHRIWLWYHAEGKEPDWQVPELEHLTNGKLQPVGFTVCELDSHNEDTPENGADVAHLDYLHGPRAFVGQAHFTDVSWEPHPTEKHVALLRMSTKPPYFFGLLNLPANTVQIEQIGPCFATLHLDSPVLGELQLIISVTPVGPMRQRIVTTGYTRRGPISFYIGKKALYEQYYQIWGDLPVWANKKYVRNPPFVKEDHLIAKHRRFFAQFYSENSPKYDPKDESMDW
ncbi:cholesterol 7-desaturase-like [Patiria miniata]|uniref:cholesterol 7-desaturase n=1 Tax=Patiria miniata TaxID=46514 RepID=A0A914A8B9_PATMI|nr:cholesterol 7-desaturase-like [Patiria miniata]